MRRWLKRKIWRVRSARGASFVCDLLVRLQVGVEDACNQPLKVGYSASRLFLFFPFIFSVQDRSTHGKRLVAAQVQLAQREQRLSRFQKAPLFQVNVDWLRTCRYIARFALFAGSKACQNGRKPC